MKDTQPILNNTEGTYIKTVHNKPIIVFIAIVFVGVLLIVLANVLMKLFGVVFIIFAIFVYKRFNKRDVADIYEEFIIIHNEDDTKTKIKWEDIKTWDIKISSHVEDELTIEMNDEEIHRVFMVGISKISVYFKKYAFDKNYREQVKARENAKGSSFPFTKKGR
ncbi:MAG: hypothetical protein GX760_03020 [Erysipelothrix sp.]|nr:hypothetical protein [Erysipelothrix sp.]